MQRSLRTFHLWLGLVAGIFISIMGISGLLIVFRSDIEGMSAPPVAKQNLGARPARGTWLEIERQLSSMNPDAHISRVVFPPSAGGLLLIQTATKDKRRVEFFADAESGKILCVKQPVAWLNWVVDLHQNLLIGKTGRAATGIIGAALLLLSLSGLASWLTGRRDWKRALALPRGGPWQRVNFELHRWPGLWLNLLLIVVSFTGIVLAYPGFFSVEQRSSMSSRKTRAERGERLQLLSLADYVRAAEGAVAGGVIRELRLSGGVSAMLWAPGDLRPKGASLVVLDVASAKILSVQRPGPSLVEYANAIHKVELGGLPVKLLWSLSGLLPAFLAVSGGQIWWTRRQAARRTARRIQLAARVPSPVME